MSIESDSSLSSELFSPSLRSNSDSFFLWKVPMTLFLENYEYSEDSPSRIRARKYDHIPVPIGTTVAYNRGVEIDNSAKSGSCWYDIEGESFHVREGPNYSWNKFKAPSMPSLCEAIAVDLWRTKSKTRNIGQYLDLPSSSSSPIVLINCMIPNYEPSNPFWGSDVEDGFGYSLVSYFRLRPELLKLIDCEVLLKNPEPPFPALALYNSFISNSSFDFERFKMISRIPEVEHVDVNIITRSLIKNFNNTPFLTRPQHEYFREVDYVEFDIDVHKFGYLPRSGLQSIIEVLEKVMFEYAFVLEGRSDKELPENVLGCVGLSNIRPELAISFPY